MSRKATIQKFICGEWVTIGQFESKGSSHQTAAYFEYDMDYAVTHIAEECPYARAGLRYPVNFELYKENNWPAFLLDLMPSGAGRRVWARRLGIKDDYSYDMELLLNGAGNAPGNIRILEAVIPPNSSPHPGFTQEEVISRKADFIEYAEEKGAIVAGATDVAGDAPKYMLVRDKNQRWHPDGALHEDEILDCWLVKFPRGKQNGDYTVLRNEAPYYEVARAFGLRVGKPLLFIDDCLFIPRFDRAPGTTFIRHGLETIASAMGKAEYGFTVSHRDVLEVIATYATDPQLEMNEYLRREVLNAALRNTDNHARNTAFLKTTDGRVGLSPLYDFAPMFLDPEGVARTTKWGREVEKSVGEPDWIAVCRMLESLYPGIKDLAECLFALAGPVHDLPVQMVNCGVEADVIDGVALRCIRISEGLYKLGKEFSL